MIGLAGIAVTVAWAAGPGAWTVGIGRFFAHKLSPLPFLWRRNAMDLRHAGIYSISVRGCKLGNQWAVDGCAGEKEDRELSEFV